MSELRVDKIVSSSGSGSVEFTHGINLPEGVVISGIAQTAQSLTPNSNVNTSGIITASAFVGDGSNLTGIAVTSIEFGDTRISIDSTDGSVNLTSNDVLVATISSEKVFYYVPIDMGFPTGDYGDISEITIDSFNQEISGTTIFDCLTTPSTYLSIVDLGVLT